jgi:uncharacterized C2H2 Zn-finger protein
MICLTCHRPAPEDPTAAGWSVAVIIASGETQLRCPECRKIAAEAWHSFEAKLHAWVAGMGKKQISDPETKGEAK